MVSEAKKESVHFEEIIYNLVGHNHYKFYFESSLFFLGRRRLCFSRFDLAQLIHNL